MPRQHRFALGARFSEQPVVVAPLPDLQQLPTEYLRQGLARDLALQREYTLTERRAQPGVQVDGGRFGHNARITDRPPLGFGLWKRTYVNFSSSHPWSVFQPIHPCIGVR